MPLKAWNYVHIRERVYAGTFMHMLINAIFLPSFIAQE